MQNPPPFSDDFLFRNDFSTVCNIKQSFQICRNCLSGISTINPKRDGTWEYFFSVEIFSKIFAILKLAQRFKKSSLKMRQSSSLNPSLNMKQGLLNNSLYCSWSSSLQSTTNPLLKMSAKHYTDLNKAIWQQLKKKLLISHLRSSSLEGRQLAEY